MYPDKICFRFERIACWPYQGGYSENPNVYSRRVKKNPLDLIHYSVHKSSHLQVAIYLEPAKSNALPFTDFS